MEMQQFIEAVDSVLEFPHMIGIIGGEPLLVPHFEEMCSYLREKLPKEKCGLWTCLPKGFEHYREAICSTFGHILLNDHTRNDVLHSPVLVSAKELCKDENDKAKMWYLIDHCWVQNCWSASINPTGAYFCEVAAALSLYLRLKVGWKVEPGWWEKIPIQFKEQAEACCPLCGCAMPLMKRASIEGIDDISPLMFERIKNCSPKIEKGKYKIHDLKMFRDMRNSATYKDEEYRAGIAERYGIFLMINDLGYQTPYLKRDWDVNHNEQKPKTVRESPFRNRIQFA